MRAACFATGVAVCVLSLGQQALAEACRAQNILTACLSMQNLQFKKCEYDEWQCKCHAQKKILTCYDNCPDSENRTLQEMQVQIYCAAVNGKEYNSELIDRMTRPAKVVADEEQQGPPTHAPEPKKDSQKPAPPPAQTPNDKKINDEPLMKGGGRDGNDFSVINNAAIDKVFGLISAVALILAAISTNFI